MQLIVLFIKKKLAGVVEGGGISLFILPVSDPAHLRKILIESSAVSCRPSAEFQAESNVQWFQKGHCYK